MTVEAGATLFVTMRTASERSCWRILSATGDAQLQHCSKMHLHHHGTPTGFFMPQGSHNIFVSITVGTPTNLAFVFAAFLEDPNYPHDVARKLQTNLERLFSSRNITGPAGTSRVSQKSNKDTEDLSPVSDRHSTSSLPHV